MHPSRLPAPVRPVLLPVLAPLLLAVLLAVATLGLPPPAHAGADPHDPVGTWPLSPRPEVVARFDPPSEVWGAGHRGVDLAGRAGQPVRAALPGRVTFAGRIAGRGVVVVGHGDTRTTYEPVGAGVRAGDVVAGGQVLGALELAGSHCFPRACLHWGWIRGETYLDPLRLVGAGPVRLLPLWQDRPAPSVGAPGPPRPAGAPASGRAVLTPAGVLAGTRGAAGRW